MNLQVGFRAKGLGFGVEGSGLRFGSRAELNMSRVGDADEVSMAV